MLSVRQQPPRSQSQSPRPLRKPKKQALSRKDPVTRHLTTSHVQKVIERVRRRHSISKSPISQLKSLSTATIRIHNIHSGIVTDLIERPVLHPLDINLGHTTRGTTTVRPTGQMKGPTGVTFTPHVQGIFSGFEMGGGGHAGSDVAVCEAGIGSHPVFE
jgi:hypothetical protein